MLHNTDIHVCAPNSVLETTVKMQLYKEATRTIQRFKECCGLLRFHQTLRRHKSSRYSDTLNLPNTSFELWGAGNREQSVQSVRCFIYPPALQAACTCLACSTVMGLLFQSHMPDLMSHVTDNVYLLSSSG